MHLTSLSLSYFRSHAHFALDDLRSGFTAFIGPNGVGKTNILEAISLLTPGRGLRQADAADLQMQHTLPMTTPWSIHADVIGRYGPQRLGVGADPLHQRRVVHLNGARASSSTDLGDLIRCVWLTPKEDRIFMDAASARRKMMDRWVFSADPAHAGRLTRLERLLSERNRLLSMPKIDPLWIRTVESDLAETALAVATARVDYLDRLRAVMDQTKDNGFPRAQVMWQGYLESQIGTAPVVQIEQTYRSMLVEARARDAAVGGTTLGPHRADLDVVYKAKDMAAAECSTGEQKALLLTLFLAHVRLIQAEAGEAPIILLDEVTAHLDPTRRALLFAHLADVGAQVFLTATTDDQAHNVPNVRIEPIGEADRTRRKEVV